MIEALKYTLHVKGELHTGTGMGLPGLIDEFVLRDAQGLAYLPGSHIKGLVRDSCYRLWHVLGEHQELCEGQREWMRPTSGAAPEASLFCGLQENGALCLMCALFGSPSTRGGFWFSPATYADAEVFTALGLASSDSALRAQTALDPETRRARTGQLFQVEVVQPLDSFEGEVRFLGWPGETASKEEVLLAWLTASLLFIRRVGGNRRRGWGRCRFSLLLSEEDNQTALSSLGAWLEGESMQ